MHQSDQINSIKQNYIFMQPYILIQELLLFLNDQNGLIILFYFWWFQPRFLGANGNAVPHLHFSSRSASRCETPHSVNLTVILERHGFP